MTRDGQRGDQGRARIRERGPRTTYKFSRHEGCHDGVSRHRESHGTDKYHHRDAQTRESRISRTPNSGERNVRADATVERTRKPLVTNYQKYSRIKASPRINGERPRRRGEGNGRKSEQQRCKWGERTSPSRNFSTSALHIRSQLIHNDAGYGDRCVTRQFHDDDVPPTK